MDILRTWKLELVMSWGDRVELWWAMILKLKASRTQKTHLITGSPWMIFCSNLLETSAKNERFGTVLGKKIVVSIHLKKKLDSTPLESNQFWLVSWMFWSFEGLHLLISTYSLNYECMDGCVVVSILLVSIREQSCNL